MKRSNDCIGHFRNTTLVIPGDSGNVTVGKSDAPPMKLTHYSIALYLSVAVTLTAIPYHVAAQDDDNPLIPDAVEEAVDETVDAMEESTDQAVDTVGAPVAGEDRVTEGNLSVYFENDLFAGSDQDYTNGTRLSWLSRNLSGEEMPRISRTLREAFNFGYGDDIRMNYGFSLQQLMFTPSDISVSELIPDDRPYAGWTAIGLSLHAKTLNTIRSLELSLGVVGESAYAHETQDWVHDWRDIPKAQGWDNQLEDELAVNLFFNTQRRYRTDALVIPGVEWDLLPRHGVAVGNVLTAANLGMALRVGYNLPENFADQKLSPTAYNQEVYYDDKGRKIRKGNFSLYLFGGADAQAKAWDIFLDGNTTGDSHNVTKDYFVGSLEAGLGMRLWSTHITYTHTFRTQEFRTQKDDPEFGSIAVTIPF